MRSNNFLYELNQYNHQISEINGLLSEIADAHHTFNNFLAHTYAGNNIQPLCEKKLSPLHHSTYLYKKENSTLEEGLIRAQFLDCYKQILLKAKENFKACTEKLDFELKGNPLLLSVQYNRLVNWANELTLIVSTASTYAFICLRKTAPTFLDISTLLEVDDELKNLQNAILPIANSNHNNYFAQTNINIEISLNS